MGIWDSAKGFFKEAYGKGTYAVDRFNDQLNQYAKQAIYYGDVTKAGAMGRNDGSDAFRHTIAAGLSTKDYGSVATNAAGTLHEISDQIDEFIRRFTKDPGAASNPRGESAMDLHNNTIGIELGKRAMEENWTNARLAFEVKKALDEGKLISQPPVSLMDYYRRK